MYFPEEYFNDDYERFETEEEVKQKVKTCSEYIHSGNIFSNIEFFEETIQLCIEYDLLNEGLELTEVLTDSIPYNSEIWQFRGILFNNSFNFDEGYKCFLKSISLNPNDVETLINKSISEDNLGMVAEATESLLKALEFEPNNEETLFNLGILHEKKDDFLEAIEYFKRATIADPEYS
ncbi:MAG: tetratricopeptide repeat protein, partial [Melioribacteraceae bacterium]